MRHRLIAIVLIIGLLLVTMGCSKTQTHEEHEQLTVGMMSAVDAIPFYLALEKGYYAQEGIDVQLVLFTNAQNRQTALQTKQVDGAMTDLVALITHTNGAFDLKGTLSTDGLFPLLTREGTLSNDTISLGTMEISVTNYVLEQYLGGQKVIEKVYINEIPARLEAIAAGQLDGGIFPEPFASVGQLRGLEKHIYLGIPRQSLNIIAFTGEALQSKRDEIAKFHKAYERAIEDLHNDAEIAFAVMASFIPNYAPELDAVVSLPEFHEPRLPDAQFIEEIIEWTESVTSMRYDVEEDALLDRSFVEEL